MGYEKRIKNRKVKLGDVPLADKGGKAFDILVEREELDIIAERLKLVRLESLQAVGAVIKLPDVPIYRIEATTIASITMLCTVSLEEFTTDFNEFMQWEVSRDPHYKPNAHSAETPNYPEYIEQDFIDPIEYAVQTLGLQIPAYPRREGASLQDWQKLDKTAKMMQKGWLTFNAPAEEEPDTKDSPFAALNKLKG